MEEEKSIKQVPSSTDWLVLESKFPQFNPAELFDFFINPEKLPLWWAPQAEADPRPTGKYHLSWPEMDWHLRGIYLECQIPNILKFSWKWDHEPDIPKRMVTLKFQPVGDGSHLLLEHSAYLDSNREQADRQSHLEGWLHFLGQLQQIN